MHIQLKNISSAGLDACILSLKDSRARWLPSNSILRLRRRSTQLYGSTLFLIATGRLDENTKELSIHIRLRAVYPIAYVLGLALILSVLFAGDIVLNGNPEPGLSEKFMFVAVGLCLWSVLYLPLTGLKKDFSKQLRKLLEENRG